MAQQSQVWWSFPGGIGWPTTIPLSGGKRSGASAKRSGASAKRKTRKGRKGRKGKATRRR